MIPERVMLRVVKGSVEGRMPRVDIMLWMISGRVVLLVVCVSIMSGVILVLVVRRVKAQRIDLWMEIAPGAFYLWMEAKGILLRVIAIRAKLWMPAKGGTLWVVA